MIRILLAAILLLLPTAAYGQDQDSPPTADTEEGANPLFEANFNEAPTYIKSESLTLLSEKRFLEYTGKVEVLHDGMRLTCDRLEALYTEDNKITKLYAFDNVFITKGENIRARSEKAEYDAATETVILTENPEIQQEGSVLTADLVRIYLEEDRSEAEGEVRVKLINTEEKEGKNQAGGGGARQQRSPLG